MANEKIALFQIWDPTKWTAHPLTLQNVILLYIQPCSPGTSVSFCRGLVLWWLHVRHAHVCICFLSNCRCNKKIGGTWRCLKVTSAILQTTSPDLTWHFLCNSLIGLITRLCRLHYKMTCTCHKLPPARQHPWFGSKNALFIHKVVRDWPVWKHLTFIPGWSKVGNGWHTMGQATSPGLVPSPSGFSRILCSLWASGRLGRPPPERRTKQKTWCVKIFQDITRYQEILCENNL